jgi:hypothetical protein
MKFAVLAALIGAAAAVSLVKESGTFDISPLANYIDISGSWEYDVTVGTSFDAGLDSDDSSLNYWAYSANTEAYASANIEFELFNSFSYKPSVTFTLWDVTPWKQYFYVVNPLELVLGSTRNQFDFGFKGEYDLNLLSIVVSVEQDIATFTTSVADYITGLIDGTSTWDDALPIEAADWTHADSYAAYDSEYLNYSLADLIDSAGTWMGTQTVCDWDLEGTIFTV